MNERAIVDAALKIADSSARRAFIEKACRGDADLLSQVESLLASHSRLAATYEFSADATSEANRVARPLSASDDDIEDEAIDLSFLSPPSKPSSIGTLGHYDIQSILGKGGFGIVLKAFDEKLHRLVAIKVMNPQMAATSPPRKRFLREARAAAGIKHENIVQVYSVEELPLPYLVMEYVEGETLQGMHDAKGPLEVVGLLSIARQIASGLAAAHGAGLIHRDIKPGNILLEKGAEPKVKITDFGLARTADDASLTRTGLISGTPMYMAPEQALGLALDHRADLFSMGSVLYQLACGRPPFRASTAIAVLRRVAEETPRPLQEIIPELPAWLVTIINRLLAKDPDSRYQSAKEVADLLGRCASELQATGKVTCVPVSTAARPHSSSRPEGKAGHQKSAANTNSQPLSKLSSSKMRVAMLLGVFVVIPLLFYRQLGSLAHNWFLPMFASTSSTEVEGEPRLATPSPEPSDPDRQIAEWVIGNGGEVLAVGIGGALSELSQLPEKPFQVYHVTFRNLPNFTVADSQRLTAASELHHVGFIDSTLAQGSIEALAECKHLRELNISGGLTSDVVLAELLLVTQLRSLALNVVSVADDTCAKLGTLKQLSHVQFYGCEKISERGVVALVASPPPKLSTLNLGGMSLSVDAMQAIATLPNLQQLGLHRSKFNHTVLKELLHCPTLSLVTLNETSATKVDVAELQMSLSGCQILVSNVALAPPINNAAYRDNVRELLKRGFGVMIATNETGGSSWMFNDDPFPPGDILYVKAIDGSNEPHVVNPTIEDLHLISQLTDLSGLNFATIPSDGLRELLPLQNLTSLLVSSSLSDADIALLPSFVKLSELGLSIPDDEVLAVIATLPQLRQVKFRPGTMITDNGLKSLESAKLLGELHLTYTTVTVAAAQAFANTRPDVLVTGTDGKRIDPN